MAAKRFKQKTKYFSEKVKKTKHKVQKMAALIFSAAIIATAVPVVSMMAVDAQSAIYASTTAYLNLRKGAGMGYSVIKVIPSNTTVTVVDKSNSEWLKVKLSDGTTGYCSSDYLNITTDAKTTDYLNLRRGAGTNYSVIKTINPNVKVDIIRFAGSSWAQVKLTDGTSGYVCTDYLEYIATSSGSSSKNDSSTTQNTLKLSASSITLAVNKSKALTAEASSNGTVKWSSSDTKVATVSSSGTVKAVAKGTATITAVDTKTNIKATCKVTVVQPDYTSITLSDTSKTLNVGKTFTLKAKTNPSGGKVLFKSSNTSVATVNSKGVVTGVKAGNATVTAYDSTGTVKSTCAVTVKNPDSISLSKSSVSVDAGSSVKITANTSNSSMKVKWSSNNINIASVNDGVISGLKSGTAIITASDESGKIKATCTVKVNSVSSSGVSISRSTSSLTAGKTLYLKGYSSNSASWCSSDTSIATVSNGFVYAKKAGRVAISYKDNYGHAAICVVTVYDAAPVKFAYSSPNSATKNSTVTLVAITDKSRSKVRFGVDINGTKTTVEATSKTADGNTYVWKAPLKVTQAGTFSVTTYALKGNAWQTCSDGKADIYVSSKTNSKTPTLDKLRASDNVIKFIGEKEGFVSKITYDTLANNLPTLGHGYVVWEGETFYNNLTKNEAYALLVDAVNNGSYTKAVNNMLVNNKIKFNQQQFDALVSFSYNLGTGWTSDSDLKDILMNSIGTSTSDTTLTGTVNTTSGLNLRSEPTTSSDVITILSYGEKVTLVSSQKYNSVWYKVKTSSGKTGYCSSTYLNISTSGQVERNLNYVNKNALIKEMLSYHHACGVCYYGLLYRRADELEMFLYNDYVADGRDNNHNFPNPSCISFP